MQHLDFKRATNWLLVAQFIYWALYTLILRTNLDASADMYELYAWGIFPQLGTFKHPPLLSWLAGAWFYVMPTTDWCFYLLSIVNFSLAIFFIGKAVEKFFVDVEQAQQMRFLTTVWCLLCFTFGTTALKLNMNTVLLPLWAATFWLWLLAVRYGRLGSTVLLGVVAALSVLGKYYSGVFLVGLLITSLLNVQGRKWLLSYKPYLSVAIFILVLLPHIYWVINNDYLTFKYVQEQEEATLSYSKFLTFSVMAVLPSLCSAMAVYFIAKPWRRNTNQVVLQNTALTLFVSIILLTLVIALGMSVQLSTPWAYPISFALPLAVMAYFSPQKLELSKIKLAAGVILVFWLVLFLASAANQYYKSLRGQWSYYVPRQELVAKLEKKPALAQWVGGIWDYATAYSFYAGRFIYAIPGLPGVNEAKVNTPADWSTKNGLLIYDSYDKPLINTARQWLAQQPDLTYCEQNIVVYRQGWRFLMKKEFNYQVFWVYPRANKMDCSSIAEGA